MVRIKNELFFEKVYFQFGQLIAEMNGLDENYHMILTQRILIEDPNPFFMESFSLIFRSF